jgi:hypothetical protein
MATKNLLIKLAISQWGRGVILKEEALKLTYTYCTFRLKKTIWTSSSVRVIAMSPNQLQKLVTEVDSLLLLG